ncbi:MAG TPA: hypothetical protein VLT83_00045 [Opitutaceae bacterium]|nr:hypothetical protein [Opitutaceae bacterium]
MNRLRFIAAVALLASVHPYSHAASTATRPYASSHFCVEIDGVNCGSVEKCEGGDLRASVVVESPAGGALPKKHIASPACAPLVLTVGIPFDPVVAAWITDLCANGTTRKTVRLLEYDVSMQFRAGVEADNTALVEVDFPAFDASDKSPALLTLVLAPGSTQPLTSDTPAATTATTTVAYAAVARKSPVTVFAYTVAIDGIGTSYVNRIEPITIKRSLAAGAATEFSDFTVSLGAADAAPWQSWFNDFVVNGNSGDAQEKNGTLTLVDVNLKPVLALQFSHLGMVRLSPSPYDSTADAIRMDQAEMYYEALTLTLGGWAGGTSSGSSTTQGSSTAPGSSTTSVSPTNPAASITPPPKAGIVPSGTTPVAPGLAPAGSSPSTTTGVTGTPSLSTPIPGAAVAVPPVPTVAGSSPTLTTLPTSPAAASAVSPVPGLPTALPPMPSISGAEPALTTLSPSPGPALAPGSGPAVSPASTPGVAPSSTPIPASASPAIFTSAPTAPGSPAPAPAAPGATTSPTITVPGMGAPTAAPAALASVAPGAAPPRPLTGALAMTAPALPIAAADQTPAALANFPALSGATRTWFSSSRGKSTWQERANFTAAVAPENAVNPYAQQIAGAGWDEVSRSESGDAAALTHQFTVDLRKDQTIAHVILAQNQKQGTNLSVTLTTQFPGSSAPALGTGSTAAPATGATAAASDRGVRDPADFPRLPGSIRTSFTATSQKTSSQEIATYTARCSPAAADAFYTQSLPGADWDELTRDETLNDVSKADQISAKWQNGSRIAVLALSGSTAGGADIRVTVTTQVSGTP